MQTEEEIKTMVKKQYSKIALQDKQTNESSCCGATACCTEVSNIMADDYKDLKGYNPEADLGLGCGLPTQFAKIKKGDFVIDLGSGAGNDCFIARSETGETGKVIGIDMTEAMINRARVNSEKLNYHNVEFRLGEIESMPVTSNTVDVIVSNCVLNLVPDKRKAFREIHRVLKPGGHFSISDIVLSGKLPQKIMQTAELYAGCVSGGIPKDEYMTIIKELEFENITIQKEKRVTVPDDVLANYLSNDEMQDYKNSGAGVFSITVYADKKKDARPTENVSGAECCDKTTCCK